MALWLKGNVKYIEEFVCVVCHCQQMFYICDILVCLSVQVDVIKRRQWEGSSHCYSCSQQNAIREGEKQYM